MKYALIVSVIAIAGVFLSAILTYPAYQKQKEDEQLALNNEDREKGEFLYETQCATKCHVELSRAAIANPDKYVIASDKMVYPTKLYSSKYWNDLLNNNIESRCKGIASLDERTKELLYAYLNSESADNEINSEAAIKEFKDDIIKGFAILKASKGAEIFASTCKSCHSENLSRAFTEIEWRLQFGNYAQIHKDLDEAQLPSDERFEELKAYLLSTSASNETDAKVIRNLLRQLRTSENNISGDSDAPGEELIPDEISWNDLDWEYAYDKGIQGLHEKFPGKPIIMELTNKYS